MTKTVHVTDLKEIKLVKISCKKCGYAMQLPLKIPEKHNIFACPSCDEKLSLSHDSVKTFLYALKSLQDNLKNDTNFSNTLIEIETEEK